ncbi:MAG: hypothetical protein R2911_04960 [Caldilineaceae bacterium]
MPRRKPQSPDQLPQREEIWYVDTERMRTWVENDEGDVFRPHLLLIANGNTGMVMHSDMLDHPVEDTDILQGLHSLMQGKGGLFKTQAYRPSHVYMQLALATESLTLELGKLGIQLQFVDRPEEISDMLAQMASFMFEGEHEEPPSMLSVEGVTPELVGGVFAAATAYYDATPWYVLTDETPLAIDVVNGGGKRFAVVMGGGGIEYGLAVYKEWADLERLYQFTENPLETVAEAGSHSLLFGEIMGLPFDDVDAIEEYGWEVADEDAYPLFVIFSRDQGVLRPSPADLIWYEAALRAIPQFVEQHEEALDDMWLGEEQPPLEATYQVQTAAGEYAVRITCPGGTLPDIEDRPFAMGDMQGIPPELAKMLEESGLGEVLGQMFDDDDEFDDEEYEDEEEYVNGAPPAFDRRGMEGMIAQLTGQRRRSSPLDRAQELMYQAWEESNPARRVILAHEALEISPDCADAYVLLAEEEADTVERALHYYEQGVAAGERALGPQVFAEDTGHFWGLLETRPYMRARQGLAEVLWRLGRTKEAIHHYRELLVLNPGDNQGVRYTLLNLYMDTGQDAEARALQKAYDDDGMAEWLYTRALLAFRQDGAGRQSDKLLRAALEMNPHVPQYLTARKRLPATPPPYIGFGDDNEAISYAGRYLQAWRKTKARWVVEEDGEIRREWREWRSGRSGGVEEWRRSCGFSPLLLSTIYFPHPFEDRARPLQPVPGGGETGVGGDLEEDFGDLFLGGAIVERHFYVEFQRADAAQPGQQRNAAQAARAQIQPRSAPDFAAHHAHNGALEVGRERGKACPQRINFVGAHHLGKLVHAALVLFVVHEPLLVI